MNCQCPSPARSLNPRRLNSCLRCGRQIPPPPGERDIRLEQRLTREAADAIGSDAEDLIGFAEGRAHDGPVEGLPGRSLIREALEELADARNYVVWALVELYRDPEPDEDELTCLLGALQTVVLGFEKLRAAGRAAAGA